MYQVGDRVIYGIHGICTVTCTETKVIDRKQVEYYVLEPEEQPGAKFYIPTHNQAALAKLKKPLTYDELQSILRSDDLHDTFWIPDESKRKLYYRELIGSGDRTALLRMIVSLYRHRQSQAEAGRKFHMCDDNFLRDAQKLLNAEFAMVLGISQDQVGDYVQSRIGTK